MFGSHLCIPRNETVQPRYFQNRIIMFCLPIPTLIYPWEIYAFPGSICLFGCSQICGPILGIYKSLTEGTEAGQLLFWEYINSIIGTVYTVEANANAESYHNYQNGTVSYQLTTLEGENLWGEGERSFNLWKRAQTGVPNMKSTKYKWQIWRNLASTLYFSTIVKIWS